MLRNSVHELSESVSQPTVGVDKIVAGMGTGGTTWLIAVSLPGGKKVNGTALTRHDNSMSFDCRRVPRYREKNKRKKKTGRRRGGDAREANARLKMNWLMDWAEKQ